MVHHPDFPKIGGPNYLAVLDRAEAILKPNWYIAIGSRSGASLERRDCNLIGVDPKLTISAPVFDTAQQMHFTQMTSEDFF